MNKKSLVVLMAAALLVLACNPCGIVTQFLPGPIKQAIAPEPTETPTLLPPPLPGLRTPLPPATPPLALGTPLPPPSPGGASAGALFTDALNKAKAASKYRVESKMSFGATKAGKYEEMVFVDVVGEVDGKNVHLTSKGGLLSLMGGDQKATIEIIEADGKTYMKGISMFGMTDPKVWYVQKDSSSGGQFKGFVTPDYYDGFTRDSRNEFKKVRSESLDGRMCDVYFYDYKSLKNAAIIGALGSAQDKSDLSAIDKAEGYVWLCADGYVHQFTLDFQGHDQQNPNEKGAMKIYIHMWDFNNAAIVVQAPKDAKPMPGQ